MAVSSNGASSACTQVSSSSSEEFQQNLDERKRKRMASNRESALRSRMRKQKHLGELKDQVSELTKNNKKILTSINVTSQLYLNVEAENLVLRAQMSELSARLQTLSEIVDFINSSNRIIKSDNFDQAAYYHPHHQINDDTFKNPWNSFSVNQSFMSSADIILY